jgi:hypothetical protein
MYFLSISWKTEAAEVLQELQVLRKTNNLALLYYMQCKASDQTTLKNLCGILLGWNLWFDGEERESWLYFRANTIVFGEKGLHSRTDH